MVGRESGHCAASSARWPDPDFVVDGTSNPLFTTEIAFGRLNRNVPKQKLDLLQFTSRSVAKPCAGSAEVVRR